MPPNPEYLAWLNAEYLAGRMKSPHTALGQLRAHPRTFLRQHPISNTWDRPATGAINAYLCNGGGGHRPGSILKTTRMHAAETFNLSSALGLNGDGCAFLAFGLQTGHLQRRGQHRLAHAAHGRRRHPDHRAPHRLHLRRAGYPRRRRGGDAPAAERGCLHGPPGARPDPRHRRRTELRPQRLRFHRSGRETSSACASGSVEDLRAEARKISLSIRNVERIWPE
jgi:hypothetical protein